LYSLSSWGSIGIAEITGGAISGSVPSNVFSGYVVISVWGGSDNDYYITSSQISLNSSMSLDLAGMTKLQ
jgi:hypothetical protein